MCQGVTKPPFLNILICFSVAQVFLEVVAGLNTASEVEISHDGMRLVRQEAYNAIEHIEKRILVQTEGDVDSVEIFNFVLPEGMNISDVEITQTSSNPDVLKVLAGSGISNENMLITTASAFGVEQVNVTSSNSFNLLVGKTDYTVTARLKITGSLVYQGTIQYTIVGISIYKENIAGSKQVVTGLENIYELGYEEALASLTSEKHELRCIVQYPDGSSSEDTASGLFPQQSSLDIFLLESQGQFAHNEGSCNQRVIGQFSEASGLTLPPGCGYGFYRNTHNQLCFGIAFIPYRAGKIRFEIEWNSLVSGFSDLAEEGFSTSFSILITGTPPIVVTGVTPVHKYRQEGGQVLVVNCYNADLWERGSLRFNVEGGQTPFKYIPTLQAAVDSTTYIETIRFWTEQGSGEELNWDLQYSNGTENHIKNAIKLVEPPFVFSYDPLPISIRSIAPTYGLELGGEMLTVSGYFAGFNFETDGIYFSGVLIRERYFVSVTATEMKFLLPPRTELGEGYEHDVYVRVGRAISNSKEFQYVITYAQVRVTQTGTTLISAESDIYAVGDCTAARFTSVLTPFASQIQSYQWSLFEITGESDSPELLQGMTSSALNRSAQTIELMPQDLIVDAMYTLHIRVQMTGTVAEKSLTLKRESATTVGAFVLTPTARSIAYPQAPLRLYAVVRIPGDCYQGDQGLMVEWTAFGASHIFSAEAATGEIPKSEALKSTPARLGWEFLIPQKNLTYGEHSVEFRTWMKSNAAVQGSARATIRIVPSALQGVIRGGETIVTVNAKTSLLMTAANSYDPDETYLANGGNTGSIEPLVYEWGCMQTTGARNFTETETVETCIEGFLPNGNNSISFEIPKELLAAMSDLTALRYELIVKRGTRASQLVSTIVEIDQSTTAQQYLSDFTVSLQNIDQERLSLHEAKYFAPTILYVSVPSNDISWAYELVSPRRLEFVNTQTNLIESPVYFSPETRSIDGNKKPLAIAPFALDPFTNYTFKITFTGSADYETTSAFVSFRTSGSPALTFPEPTVMNGTTQTQFTVTAGLPQNDHLFSYYFFLTDSANNTICVGGCTGYAVAYFRIGRPGQYKLSVKLFDTQGKAKLAEKDLENPIIVSASNEEHDIYNELPGLFENGDDNSWTQLAYDLVTSMNQEPSISTAGRPIDRIRKDFATPRSVYLEFDSLSRQEEGQDVVPSPDADRTSDDENDKLSSPEPDGGSSNATAVVSSEKSKPEPRVQAIADGLRRIFCASRPTTGHAALGVGVAEALTKIQSALSDEVVYNVMASIECCVDNIPQGSVADVHLDDLINNLELFSQSPDARSTGARRRLLQTAGDTPVNIMADIYLWTGKQLTAVNVGAKADGYSASSLEGRYKVIVASNLVQMSDISVNGKIQKGLTSGSDGELSFYTSGVCATSTFSEGGNEKRYIVAQVLPNFIVDGLFQDPPPGGNLADGIYSVQVYEKDVNGRLQTRVMDERQDVDPCFCYQLPILYGQENLTTGLDSVPAMYLFVDKKTFGEDVFAKGEVFNYDLRASSLAGYNVEGGWVVACARKVGLVAPRIGSASDQNALGIGAELLGISHLGLIGMILAGIVFVVVAVVATWVVATRAVAAGEASPVALAAHELYVERDIYGRGTIFDARNNANARTPKARAAQPAPST